MKPATDQQRRQAVAALNIRKPIYRAEVDKDGNVTLYLYGGEVKKYAIPRKKKPPQKAGETPQPAKRKTTRKKEL